MKFSSNFAATLTLYTLQKHVQSGARCTTQSDARIQTLLWFGSSQVVFVCGRRICAAVCWGHRFAQWFSTASKELGVQYAQVCSKHLFKQSVIEVKTLGIIRLLHVSICFIWIDHSACFFSWKRSFAGDASSTGFGSNPQDRKQGDSKTSLCTVTAAAKVCTKEKVQLSCSWCILVWFG